MGNGDPSDEVVVDFNEPDSFFEVRCSYNLVHDLHTGNRVAHHLCQGRLSGDSIDRILRHKMNVKARLNSKE